MQSFVIILQICIQSFVIILQICMQFRSLLTCRSLGVGCWRRIAGRQGFEPRLIGPEPIVLPLDDLPILHLYSNNQVTWKIIFILLCRSPTRPPSQACSGVAGRPLDDLPIFFLNYRLFLSNTILFLLFCRIPTRPPSQACSGVAGRPLDFPIFIQKPILPFKNLLPNPVLKYFSLFIAFSSLKQAS